MKEEAFVFSAATEVYPMEAIYGACYVFTDRAYVDLEPEAEGRVRVRLRGKTPLDGPALERLSGEFHNEMLHQAFRRRVAASNQKIREYIVTRALVSAQGPSPDCRSDGPSQEASVPSDDALAAEIKKLLAEVEKRSDQEDPLGINAPWEEKTSPPAVAGEKKDPA